MVMARIFIGTMLSFGSVVVIGVMLLMAADITRIAAQSPAKPQRIVYMGHLH